MTLYIVKREKAIQKECVPPIQERTKLLSKREEREETQGDRGEEQSQDNDLTLAFYSIVLREDA